MEKMKNFHFREAIQMAKEYFCAYHSCLEAMEPLNDAERGRLFTACLTYSKTGESIELRGNERFIFPSLRAQIDRDTEKYSSYIDKQTRNGQKGGRPPKHSESQKTQAFSEEPKKPNTNTKTKTNTNNPLTPEPGEQDQLPGLIGELRLAVEEWVCYKDEKRQGYKPRGLKALCTEIGNNAALYGDKAVIDVIYKSMSNNWQGIAFDRLKAGANGSGTPEARPKKQAMRIESDENGNIRSVWEDKHV